MEVEPIVLADPDPDTADSLVSSNEPDDIANEQTWPTEEEMNAGDGGMAQTSLPDAENGTTPKAVRRIPKGMSEYQAAWIIEEEDSGEDSEEHVENPGGEIDMEDVVQEEEEEMEDMPIDDREMEMDSRRSVAFQDLDNEEEEKQ
jgi:pre-rRNA-processing protein TSR1